MSDGMARLRAELRHEPTDKRIRAVLGGQTVVDTTRALLVWEPRRIVPSYAVPLDDLRAELKPVEQREPGGPERRHPDLLHPGVPFAVHSTAGESLSVSAGGQTRDAAAFRPADPDLAGHVVLDFDAMDAWYEEDEPVHSHPRDPYHLVEVRASSRHVRIEHDGRLVADTNRAVLLFETGLPARFYLPREDVVATLHPSELTTYCPYKGRATYWSLDSRRNVVWSYREPLPAVTQIAGLLAFYNEVVDVTVDGVPRGRPDSVFSKALRDEFAV
jgi:uncharacterized protein (DUF427 family)